jgi:hypothetical protein
VGNGVDVTVGIKGCVGGRAEGISEAVAMGMVSTVGVIDEAFCPQDIKSRKVKI